MAAEHNFKRRSNGSNWRFLGIIISLTDYARGLTRCLIPPATFLYGLFIAKRDRPKPNSLISRNWAVINPRILSLYKKILLGFIISGVGQLQLTKSEKLFSRECVHLQCLQLLLVQQMALRTGMECHSSEFRRICLRHNTA